MEAYPKTIKMYQRNDGEIPFTKWITALRDVRGRQKILARVDRARLGNFGDHRSVGDAVIELKVHFGPGYRVYLGQEGESIVILLLGGDKSTQDEDIKQAKVYWKDYQKEKRHANG